MKAFLIVLMMFSLTISGCASSPKSKEVGLVDIEKTVLTHPELPNPILSYNLKWYVYVIDKDVYVGLSYNDSIEFRKMLEDTKRYIKESNAMLCYYRSELKEDICKKD